LGFLATRIGNIPLARRRFDEALLAYVRLGLPTHQLKVDRAGMFTAARLIPEARHALAEAADALEQAGLPADAAEARLALSEACLADHDVPAALEQASKAHEAFERQGREVWAVLSRDMKERAYRLVTGLHEDPTGICQSAVRSAQALERAGWPIEALQARVTAARAALVADRPRMALLALGSLARSEPGSGSGTVGIAVTEQVLRMHAEALALLAAGRPRSALDPLRSGLELATEQALALRRESGRGGHGQAVADLASTGLGIVLGSGSALEILEWAERWRLVPTARGSTRLLPAAEMLSLLDAAVFVEFVSHRGRMLAVTAAGGSLQLCDLAPVAEVEKACAVLQFAVRNLTRARTTSVPSGPRDGSRLAMAACFHRSVLALDRLLDPVAAFDRLSSVAKGPEVVIVPSGPLHDVPWGLLPTLCHKAVTVAPSLATWIDSADPGGEPRRVLLVAGPGLRCAEDEVRALVSECYQAHEVNVVLPEEATRCAVLEALSRCDVAHLATHGHYRSDNPEMSSLGLKDGDLTVHEVSELGHLPRCVVLSACDAGRVSASPGDEVGGIVPALLTRGPGCGTAIAAGAPLVDSAMPALSVALHRRLLTGMAAYRHGCLGGSAGGAPRSRQHSRAGDR
ncbi:MAG: CHAT domain-containing protein, partial [Acidimicrobiales bacterium]